MIGWAARRTEPGGDAALTLEALSGGRFGGLDVTFGPGDHTSVEPINVGLWVVPKRGAARESRRLPGALPWVPLARGFSTSGGRTQISGRDRRFLFRAHPAPMAPRPLSAA